MARRLRKNDGEYPETQADLLDIMEELELNQSFLSSATDEAEGIDKDEYLSSLERNDIENIKRRGR